MSDLHAAIEHFENTPALRREFAYTLQAMKDARERIERLEAVLQKIVDRTPANEHKKWPHHHWYLTQARKGLKDED